MVWSAEEILEWVNSHGGLDGGGLEELQRTVDEGRFSADRERGAKRFLSGVEKAKKGLQREAEARDELAKVGKFWSDAERADQQDRLRAEQLREQDRHFVERSVLAAESQADSAREALKTSRVAAGLSLFALIVAFIALLAQLKGTQQ